MALGVAVLLGGAYWGPSRLIQVVLGAGLPQPGEVVPRQIPYRGYVEQNGVPLTSPGVPMSFRLYGIDGGVLHEEMQSNVVVQQGNFSVELGDGAPIASDAMRQNFLELEVGIGSPPQVLQGRQRILSVPFASSAGTGVPAGTVVAFAGELIPAGWLACDGAAISAAQYPSLCAALGASWGSAGTGQCRLPDLRGQFLRGAHGPAVDPTGDRPVGVVQGGALESHGHGVQDPGHTHGIEQRQGQAWCLYGDTQFGPSSGGAPTSTGTGQGNKGCFTLTTVTSGVSVVATGDAETRPVNTSVNYIVKY